MQEWMSLSVERKFIGTKEVDKTGLKLVIKIQKNFTKKANQREQRNSVRYIKNEAGERFEDEDEITECFATYFEQLFTSNNNCEMEPVIDLVEPLVDVEQVSMLDAPFRRE